MSDFYDAGVDIGYQANVTIGTPGQVFGLIPDTGSADLWVPGSQANDPNHNLFNSAASSTFQSTNQKFSDSYGLGQASGNVARDTVQFAGFTITNKTFGVATSVDQQFQQQFNDGIIGMASSVLSNMSAYTFFEDLIQQKQIDNPYFSVFLVRGRQYTQAVEALVGGSSICLGCMAQTENVQASGSLFYVPITLFAFYEVQVSSISLNGQAIGSTSHLAIIDTGTTDFVLPSSIAAAMMAPVNGILQRDGSYVVPVGNINTNTKFTVNFGQGSINMNPLDLIAGYADNSRQYYLMNVYASDTQDPNGRPLAIYGDVFIKNALTVFSYSYNGSPAVGFQQLNANSGSADATGVSVVTATYNPGVVTSGTLARTGTRTNVAFTSSAAATAATASSARSAGEKLEVRGVGAVVMSSIGVMLGMVYIL